MNNYEKIALMASPTREGQSAAEELSALYDFVPIEEAQAVIILGGDGFMLQCLHLLLEQRKSIPVYGMNRGTIGFLMNSWHQVDLMTRLNRAKMVNIKPLRMTAMTTEGETITHPAINEVSLLRETRQAAKIQVEVNGRTVIPELICDGVLVASPAGSTAYNLSANGPILPLDSSLFALTAISPFRPRRWKGAILPDRYEIKFTILERHKRPVSAVADQREIREIASVQVDLEPSRTLQLLFDPDHALDDRIAMEQFVF
ncbi:NAD kinase [Sphingorhabdus lutea]|uniref:NAD kinase n=1 Tax=Sphingorhabdus lutea TaxID=1913578 RepID=A0A1L3JF12_9SPHN|nr:NAD kinase [Sphingorhabdus lutea]APG63710.1 NAD kinase [Sphingorhabdus lutea]